MENINEKNELKKLLESNGFEASEENINLLQETACECNNQLRTMSDLTTDEYEAIEGYNKAIELFENSDLSNKEEIVSKLKHIKEEEVEHIEELTEILNQLQNC